MGQLLILLCLKFEALNALKLHLLESYYNKCNAHFDVQELLLQFWTERHKMWQEYGEA